MSPLTVGGARDAR
jgi:hypothetical protein